MLKTALFALMLLLPVVTHAGMMVIPPPDGNTTVFPYTNNSFISATTLTLDAFQITGNPTFVYGAATVPLGGTSSPNNGTWSNFSFIGAGPGSFRIDLGGMYSSVGGFFNYVPRDAIPYIAALDAAGVEVERYYLATSAPISTPGQTNQGAFRGITIASPLIRSLVVGSTSTILMHSITVAGAAPAVIPDPDPVSELPEPGTWMAGIFALLLAVPIMRRR